MCSKTPARKVERSLLSANLRHGRAARYIPKHQQVTAGQHARSGAEYHRPPRPPEGHELELPALAPRLEELTPGRIERRSRLLGHELVEPPRQHLLTAQVQERAGGAVHIDAAAFVIRQEHRVGRVLEARAPESLRAGMRRATGLSATRLRLDRLLARTRHGPRQAVLIA